MLGAGGDYPAGSLSVGRAVEAAHPPRAEVALSPVAGHLQDLSLVEEPGREARRGGAENDRDAARGQDRDSPVEEGEVVAALFGLDEGPGEFHDPRDVEAEGFHAIGVGLPPALVPLLGIPIDPE